MVDHFTFGERLLRLLELWGISECDTAAPWVWLLYLLPSFTHRTTYHLIMSIGLFLHHPPAYFTTPRTECDCCMLANRPDLDPAPSLTQDTRSVHMAVMQNITCSHSSSPCNTAISLIMPRVPLGLDSCFPVATKALLRTTSL